LIFLTGLFSSRSPSAQCNFHFFEFICRFIIFILYFIINNGRQIIITDKNYYFQEGKMPHFNIMTNQSLDASLAQDFAREASSFASRLLGKPEKYMMVSIQHGACLMFSQTMDPTAYIELKSIGMPKEKCEAYSKAICDFMESTLKIAPDRIYIDFKDIDGSMFGWNKKTF